MPTTLNIPNIDVQSNKLTITDEQVVIDSDGYGTTPLADVDAETTADTILGVKDGAVVQIEPDDIPYDNTGSGLTATDLAGAVDELNTDTNTLSSTSWTENGITYRAYRVGQFVWLTADTGTTTTAFNANEYIATVPSGYRPKATANAWDTARATRLVVNTGGAIGTLVSIANGSTIRFSETYLGA